MQLIIEVPNNFTTLNCMDMYNTIDKFSYCQPIDGVYNKAICFPTELKNLIQCALNRRYKIHTTRHAHDKMVKLGLPFGVAKALLYGEVVEAEVEYGVLKKIITRLPHRYYDVDICGAILLFEDGTAKVKTVWINDKEDNHLTLRTENYVRN